MRNPVTLGAFLVAAVVVSLVWGRSLWYCAERSQAFRRWVFFIMGFIGRPLEQVRSLLLSLIYCGLGLLAAVLFAIAFGLPVSSLVIPLSAEHLATVAIEAGWNIHSQHRPAASVDPSDHPGRHACHRSPHVNGRVPRRDS